MAKIYIPYGTVEGQTAKIADYIAEVIRANGHQAETADLKHSADPLPGGYDGVIVAASVHVGKHEGYVADFVKKNRAELERLPSALVSVSMAAQGDEETAEGYVEKFEQDTGWRPAHVGLFAGALLYTHYGFIKKHVMKKIAKDKGSLDTDTTRDYVYTEWDGVRRFTEDYLAAFA
ncbi:Protoporphyrinogen IX dehydrogenase [menaquinone] [Arthrobacter sp. Bi26]|uniref:flavodoxin domain-containing protein n=1 Tax=Arthrobacter sp. Bi26 TaxID=2822350 RepID=UPI001DCF63E5|nr:flavodoxin domain-containing protein [Arthrobacter sp. Bi26]CAH0182161.1 Protoporphyrinogen IX dehydrogenase [menaquinone] [Arthrobacter sp. Bi26]